MKSLKKLLLIVLALSVVQACSDTLEETSPSTSIDESLLLGDPGAVQALRAQMYSRLHTFTFTTNYFLGPESLAGNMTLRAGRSRYQNLNNSDLRAGLNDWATVYDLINTASILAGMGPGQAGLDNAVVDRFRGEALAMRALAAHFLVRVLGYDPGAIPTTGQGAGFNLGIVIRTTGITSSTQIEPAPRATVAEVYNWIKADLTAAIPLLAGSSDRFFITQGFALGLRARVALYERDWAGADQFATQALAATGARFATIAELPNIFDETAMRPNPEALFQVILANPAGETQGVNNSLNAYTAKQWVAQTPTQPLMDLYDPADPRLTAWYSACDDEDSTVADTDDPADAVAGCAASLAGFFGGNGIELNKWDGELTNFADDLPHMRVAELVLIQAEARLNATGVAAGIGRLNDLRTQRGLAALDPTAFDATTALNEILDERRRELAGEGHRFFDLKRLGRTITKDDSRFLDVPFTDLRVLDDLTALTIDTNPLLIQNPGY